MIAVRILAMEVRSVMQGASNGPEPTLSQYSHHFLLVSSDRQKIVPQLMLLLFFGGLDLRPTSISSLASSPLISSSGYHGVTAAEPCNS